MDAEIKEIIEPCFHNVDSCLRTVVLLSYLLKIEHDSVFTQSHFTR